MVDLDTVEEELPGPPPEPLQAVADLLWLLGKVDMDRQGTGPAMGGRHRRGDRLLGHGADRMDREAELPVRIVGEMMVERFGKALPAVRVEREPALCARERAAIHPGLHVDHGQEGEGDGADNGTRPPRCSRP